MVRVRLCKPLKLIKNERVQNFFAFLQIARNNEPITATHFNPWNYDESKQAERIAQTEISKADKLYAQALKQKDAFFANRMWFQSVRLRFYSANRSSVIDYLLKPKTHNLKPFVLPRFVLCGRCLQSQSNTLMPMLLLPKCG